MTSPYITEAMRRRELPINMKFSEADDGWWWIFYHHIFRGYISRKAPSHKEATHVYLEAINELSKEG